MTTENATQSGAFESGSSARSNALAEIAKRVHDRNAADFSSFNEDTGEVLKTAPTEQSTQQVETQDADTTTASSTDDNADTGQTTQATQATQDDGLETLLIDGRETRVKREQVLDAGKRTLQKEAAADRRLEEAAETLRRAKAYEQGIMQRQPSSDAGNYQQASSDPANGNGGYQATATPDLGTLVDQRLWIHDANKAAQRFKEEFKDLVDDPYAARLVAKLEDERLRKAASEGSPLGDPWDAYKTHGEQIRSWLGKATPKGVVQVSADKAERKRDTVTVTGSSTTRPAPVAQKPLTVTEQVEKMRQQRQQGRQIQPSR